MKEVVSSERKRLFKDEIVYESKYFSVCQDWEIAIPGFYIIFPKKQHRSLIEFSDLELNDYIATVKKVRAAMNKVLGIDCVYYFQNEDSPYGFHLWLLPYYPWMEKVAGHGPGILLPVWKHARDTMKKKDIVATRKAAQKMREYLSES